MHRKNGPWTDIEPVTKDSNLRVNELQRLNLDSSEDSRTRSQDTTCTNADVRTVDREKETEWQGCRPTSIVKTSKAWWFETRKCRMPSHESDESRLMYWMECLCTCWQPSNLHSGSQYSRKIREWNFCWLCHVDILIAQMWSPRYENVKCDIWMHTDTCDY